MFGGKIGAEGSVLRELCHFVIPPDRLTDINRLSTGDVTHEVRTNRTVTDSDRTSNGLLSPFCLGGKFWTCSKLPTGRNGHHRISPDKERIHRMRNGHRTDTNGHERIKRFLIRYSSVSPVWPQLKRCLYLSVFWSRTEDKNNVAINWVCSI